MKIMEMNERPLWSDNQDLMEILEKVEDGDYSTFDCQSLIYNLFEDIQCLQEDLEEFNNPKNWTRPYNNKGELVNEHALYLLKVSKENK